MSRIGPLNAGPNVENKTHLLSELTHPRIAPEYGKKAKLHGTKSGNEPSKLSLSMTGLAGSNNSRALHAAKFRRSIEPVNTP